MVGFVSCNLGDTLIVQHLGMLLLLTIQAATTILHRKGGGQIGVQRPWLLGYICITFVLATIGFAANVKYTEMIWIDLRNAPGGPAALIQGELSYWVNVMALSWYVISNRFDRVQYLQTSPATTSWSGSCKLSWCVFRVLIARKLNVNPGN